MDKTVIAINTAIANMTAILKRNTVENDIEITNCTQYRIVIRYKTCIGDKERYCNQDD